MSALRHAYIRDTRLQGNPTRVNVINVVCVFQAFHIKTGHSFSENRFIKNFICILHSRITKFHNSKWERKFIY